MSIKEIKINECGCDKCGHKWETHTVPVICPRCKTKKWDRAGEGSDLILTSEPGPEPTSVPLPAPVPASVPGKSEFTCFRCGEVFESGYANPARCEGCGAADWDQESEEGAAGLEEKVSGDWIELPQTFENGEILYWRRRLKGKAQCYRRETDLAAV